MILPLTVDLKSFPYHVWRKLSKEILMDDRTELFRSGDSQGEYGFRRAVARYLYQARGVNCRPDQVVIGAGSDYILMLLSIILGTDHTVAFEDPTYMQAFRLAGDLATNVWLCRWIGTACRWRLLWRPGPILPM